MPREVEPSEKGRSLYAGRWIAHIGKNIIGHGGTPDQAKQAAKTSRHKEIPKISFVPMSTPLKISPVIDRVSSAIPPDIPVYVVGGAVRDMLLGHTIHDYDFVLPGNTFEISRKIANRLGADYYPLDLERGTARVIYSDDDGQRFVLDFARYRGPDLETDLEGRDFTINAMALDIRSPQELLDPLGGASDLLGKRLRVCSPSSLSDDPVRVLRAIRMAASLGLQISLDTKQLIRAAVPGLTKISPERIRDELLRILEGKHPHTSIIALEMLGGLPYVLPELTQLKDISQSPPHTKDVWNHTLDTLRVLEGVLNFLSATQDPDDSGNLMLGLLSLRLGRYREKFIKHLKREPVTERSVRSLLFLAALYHDVAKPETQIIDDGKHTFPNHNKIGAEIITKRAKFLRFSNTEINRLKIIIKHHMRPSHLSHRDGGPTNTEIYRFFQNTSDAGIDICLLSLADVWATYGNSLSQERWSLQVDTVRSLLEAWWEYPEERICPPTLITGADLINDLHLKPGPIFEEILAAVREAQVENKIITHDDAIAYVKEFLRSKNIT